MMMEVDEAARFRTLRPPARHGIDAKKIGLGWFIRSLAPTAVGRLGFRPPTSMAATTRSFARKWSWTAAPG